MKKTTLTFRSFGRVFVSLGVPLEWSAVGLGVPMASTGLLFRWVNSNGLIFRRLDLHSDGLGVPMGLVFCSLDRSVIRRSRYH